MTILITINMDSYPHLEKSTVLTNEIINKYTNIVIKDCDIPYKDLLYYLGVLYRKGKKLIYVNNQQIQPLVYIIELMGGVVYDDLSILDDKDTLEYILSSNSDTGLELKSTADNTQDLTKAMQYLQKGDTTDKENFVKNPKLLGELINAYNGVADRVDKDTIRDRSMKNLLLDIVKSNIEYEEVIRKLKTDVTDAQNRAEIKTQDTRSNALFSFPQYRVEHPTKRVLYVIEHSPCKYITTFLMNYTDYLNVHMSKTTRMLIILPKLNAIVKRYEGFPQLTENSASAVLKQSLKRVFVTYDPRKAVLDAFLKDGTYDAFVVLDLTKSGGMLHGTNVITYGAISSLSDVARFGLNTQYLFTSLFILRESIGITKLKNYTTQSDSNKKSLYFNAYRESYAKLDRDLRLN